MANEEEGYKVGYGKPPTETRFSKGCSGNSKGRPKGKRNLSTMFHAVAAEPITVTERGKTRRISKIEGVVRQLMAKGLAGDHKAMTEVVRLYHSLSAVADSEVAATPDTQKDDLVMRALTQRLSALESNGDVKIMEEADDEPKIH